MASAVHHCKDCGLYFESSKSLDVHLHYHKDNLLSKWASQAQQPNDAGEHNNNTCNTLNHNKGGRQRGEHQHNVENNASDVNSLTRYSPPSGGNMKPSSASTACLPPGRPPSSSSSFPQPSTPNGTSPLYPHSSPAENRFSPSFNYGDANSSNGPSSAFSPVPSAGSPASMLPPPDMRSPGNSTAASNGYYSMDDQQSSGYNETQYTNGGGPMRALTPSGVQSPSSTSGSNQQQFRYHPYNGTMYGATQQTGPSPQQVTSGYAQSQCDKCGCVCESPSALLDHISACHHQQQQSSPSGARNQNTSRSSPSAASSAVVSSSSQFLDAGVNFFEPSPPPTARVKTENEAAEILDLDSHKVHVYQPPLDSKGRLPPPFSSNTQQQQQQQQQSHPVPVALVANLHAMPQHQHNEKIFHMHSTSNQGEYISPVPVTTTTSEMPRPNVFPPHPGMQHLHHMYHEMPSNPNPLLMPPASSSLVPQGLHQGVAPSHQTMSSLPHNNLGPAHHQFLHHHPLQMHQPPQNPVQPNVPPPPPPINPNAGPPPNNQSWKSNEARRPKTYNCSACNKWFTSSGHLKRHYNTTLHKNAIKQGAPDPAKEGGIHRTSAPSLPAGAGGDSSSTTTPSPAPSLGEESSSRSDDNASFGRTTPATSSGPQHPSMLPPNAASSPPNRQAGLLEAPTLAALGGTTPGGLQTPLHHNPFSINTNSNHNPISNHNPLISNSIISSSSSNSSTSPGPLHTSNNHVLQPLQPIPTQYHLQQQHIMLQQQTTQRGMLNGHVMSPHSSTPPVAALTTITNTTNGTFDPFELHNGSLPPPLGQPQTYTPLTPHHPLPSFAQFHHHAHHHHFNNGAVSPPSLAMLPPFSSMHPPFATHPPSFLVADSAMSMLDHQVTSQQPQWSAFHHHPAMSPMMASSPAGGCHSDNSSSLEADSDHLTTQIKEEIVPVQPPPQTTSRRGTGRGRGNSARGHSRTPHQTVSSSILSNGTPTTIHKCLDCDKVFNKACYLTQHNKSFHSGDKPFKCNTCGKRFPADYLYQEHLGKHAGDKPYKCEICPKQFNHKTDLRRHMCLHTGEKPYACDVCGKGFIRKDHMLKHCETHRRKMQSL